MNYQHGAKIGMLSPFLFEPLVGIHCIHIGEGRLRVCSFNNLITQYHPAWYPSMIAAGISVRDQQSVTV